MTENSRPSLDGHGCSHVTGHAQNARRASTDAAEAGLQPSKINVDRCTQTIYRYDISNHWNSICFITCTRVFITTTGCTAMVAAAAVAECAMVAARNSGMGRGGAW